MTDDKISEIPPFSGYGGMEPAAIRRYVSGECMPEEQRRIDRWAGQSGERRRYLDALEALLRRIPSTETDGAEEAWQRLLARMEPPLVRGGHGYVAPWEGPAERVEMERRRRPRILAGAFGTEPRRRWPLGAAAAAVLLAAIGLNAALGTRAGAPASHRATMRQITTAKGQRAEIQLEDGSRVVLGVESRLRLSSDFGVRTREVYLDGTAYFDVVHDSTHPFIVRTANAVARDVGTRFVVNAYPESHATRVIVRDGAVSLGGIPAQRARQPENVLVTGGKLGQLRAGDSVITMRSVDPALYTAWIQGDLVFHDVPLGDAIAELRRWYKVDVRLGDQSLVRMPISASFAVESFSEAIAVVTTVLPLRAVRRDNVVMLYRRSR
jgi:transmembrane sensor